MPYSLILKNSIENLTDVRKPENPQSYGIAYQRYD